MSTNLKPEKEKVPLMIVYKQDGQIHCDFSDDVDVGFELYGYLDCLLCKMREDLFNSFAEK